MYINLLVLDFPIVATNAKSIRRKCLGTMVRKCYNAVNKSVKIWNRHARDRDPCKGGCKCKMIKESSLSCYGWRKPAIKRGWKGGDLETELCSCPFCRRIFLLTPRAELQSTCMNLFPCHTHAFSCIFVFLRLPACASITQHAGGGCGEGDKEALLVPTHPFTMAAWLVGSTAPPRTNMSSFPSSSAGLGSTKMMIFSVFWVCELLPVMGKLTHVQAGTKWSFSF